MTREYLGRFSAYLRLRQRNKIIRNIHPPFYKLLYESRPPPPCNLLLVSDVGQYLEVFSPITSRYCREHRNIERMNYTRALIRLHRSGKDIKLVLCHNTICGREYVVLLTTYSQQSLWYSLHGSWNMHIAFHKTCKFMVYCFKYYITPESLIRIYFG
jgi:hypothetical protein